MAGYGALGVLQGLDLCLEPGEVVGLIGPNGAGKSTLLRTLVGELPPRAGTLYLAPGSKRRPAFFRIAQTPHMPPFLSLIELVSLAVRAWRDEIREPAALAGELLDRWGLAGRHNRPLRLASPGELRRALLALVEGVRPVLLLLDEALSALDPGVLVQAQELIEDLAAEGTATLFVTHDMSLGERIPGRVDLLLHGTIAQSWSRDIIEAERREGKGLLDLYLAATATPGGPKASE